MAELYIEFAGIVLFLLLAAGLFARQNRRLLGERQAEENDIRLSSRMYSIRHRSFAPHEKLPGAVPLFQFTVLAGTGEETAAGESGRALALCRVPAGSGQLDMQSAERLMIQHIRSAAIQGDKPVPEMFTEHADRKGERELIRRLMAVIKEETGHAGSY
ncbi:hypothetical protein [Paenibacillus tengchongensis]|uniref:hypothetical protein n=1 Tax=Paenibacillus tengchongensis TaxID=2608684 RepID=UPI00124E26A2|nr:hypothetical protein [Paenibacillus tengchongensis]